MLNKKLIFFSLFLIFSCSNNKNQLLEKNSYDIINICLEEIQKKAEPPVPPNWKGDTLKKLNFQNSNNLAIVQDLFEISRTEKIKRKLKGKYNLFFTEDSKVFDELINEKYIKSSTEFSFEVKTFEHVNLNKWENWKPYDAIINFSEIMFNKRLDEACLVYSVAYAKNNGYSFLVILKKVEDKWEIESSELMNLS